MGTSVRRIAAASGRMILLCCAINGSGCARRDALPEPAVPYYNTPSFTPLWTTDARVIDTLHTIGNFRFLDQDSNIITPKTFQNKIYLANFFFSQCPAICPKMTVNMKTVYLHFKNNPSVAFLSHSVTPDRDSVPVLKKYALAKGVTNEQWHFVTGSKADIYALARKSYYIEQQQGFTRDSTEFLHTENFVLVDQHSHIRGIYNGTLPIEAERIIADIELLLKEK